MFGEHMWSGMKKKVHCPTLTLLEDRKYYGSATLKLISNMIMDTIFRYQTLRKYFTLGGLLFYFSIIMLAVL